MLNPFRWLKSTYYSIQKWWQLKSPLEKWDFIIKIGNTTNHAVGVHVFDNKELNWFSATPGVLFFLFFVLDFYTIQYYWFRGAFVRGIECTYLIGFVIGNLFMYWESVGPRRFKFNAVIHFCGVYFYKSDARSQQYNDLRVKHIAELLKITVFILLMLFLSFGIAFVIPIHEFFYSNSRVTPLAINLPWLEKDSDLEFTLNMTLQIIMAFYSMCGSFSTEVASCTMIHAIMLVPDLIRFNLIKFQNEFNRNGCGWESFAHLRNTFMQLQDYELYLYNVIEVYANKLFYCPFTWAFSMSISIFSALVLQKMGGLGVAVACYLEMIVVCYMGNSAKETKKNIAKVYYDISWYQMPAMYQRYVLSAIHCAQNGVVLTMGPLGDLDYEMTTSFTRQIYKFTMVMVTMFK